MDLLAGDRSNRKMPKGRFEFDPVKLLVFAIPFRYLASHLGSVLSTRNFIWINLKITAITAVSNVILNVLLIPEHGAPGAAVATIISHAVLALLFAITVAKKLPNKSPNEYE